MGDEDVVEGEVEGEVPVRPWEARPDSYWGLLWGNRFLDEELELVLLPLSFGHVQLGVSLGRSGEYLDSWYFDDLDVGWRALWTWDGQGEPEGWVRHPSSGRRRPGGDPAAEVVRP